MRSSFRAFVLSLALASALVAYAGPDTLVYATKEGKSYHKKNCSLKKGSKSLKLSAAVKKGLKACKVCKPK